MRLVLPGQLSEELLEKAGTTKEECRAHIMQILGAEEVQLRLFGSRVPSENIVLDYDPNRQGAFSFTYYISTKDYDGIRLVAQFREAGFEATSLDVLKAAESIFGSFVPKPLFVSTYKKLQIVIWEYYGVNFGHAHVYKLFTHEQTKSVLQQYAEFIALGCRSSPSETRLDSKIRERFEIIATWVFPDPVGSIISTLHASLDDLSRLPTVAMHRDHGFHNLLGTQDGVITKVIDWGMELSYELLGVSFGKLENILRDSVENRRTEYRRTFWNSFIGAIRHFQNLSPDIIRAMKTAKDVGFVCMVLAACKERDEVTPYQLTLLEDLLNPDCIHELAIFSEELKEIVVEEEGFQ